MRFRVVPVLLLMLGGAAVAFPAAANSPRANGQIAFDWNLNRVPSGFVYVANVDGTHLRRLGPRPGCCPSWSHSGKRLAFSVGSTGIAPASVAVNGHDYKRLAVAEQGLSLGCGAWSPNDARLACEGWNDNKPLVKGVYTLS